MTLALILSACAAVQSTATPDASASGSAGSGSLVAVTSFGSNPGALQMFEYVPAGLPTNAPLVVVLHGCTQSATAIETAGWNALADQYKFAVVYPQQTSSNNPVECFNWAGEYGDTSNLERGKGENESVIQMVDTAIASHHLDTHRVFVVGFSAGAAMTSVLLATWPDRFAAGVIHEGIAYRCATSVAEAFSCQSPGVTKTAAQWGDLVRAASSVTTFPRVQIWEGTKDTTVVPANAPELVKQWTNVHGADQTVDATATFGDAKYEAYKLGATTVVEVYTVTNMTHAIAYDASDATCPTGTGQYFEDHKVCATVKAAQFFGVMSGLGGSGGGSGSGSGSAGSGSGSGSGNDTPPSVAFLDPSGGETVSGTVTVVVAASDDSAVTGVDLAIDGVAVGTTDHDAPYQFTWDASTAAVGDHELVATAHDDTGHASTASVHVTIAGAGSGSGSGSGGGSAAGSDGPGALPGCSLDAGGGGTALAPLAFALVFAVRIGRRSRASRRRASARA